MKHQKHIVMQLVLLCLVIGMVYSPAFRAEPCLLDDVSLLNGLQGDVHFDFKKLLTPNLTPSTYYRRPLIEISYWCSQTFWNATSQAMHIENVVFHMLNAILLFWLIRLSLPDDAKFGHYVPLMGALLFAVHPIMTESINWIVGRSDLIVGGCLISATIAIVAWRRKRNHWWLLLFAILLLAAAIMAKEVAWGFLIVLPFFLADPHDSNTYTLEQLFGKFARLEKLLILAAIALCFFLATLLLSFWPVVALSTILGLVALNMKPRQHPLSRKVWLLITGLLLIVTALLPYCVKLAQQHTSGGSYSNFSRTILLISLDFDNSMAIFSAALAFYIKKFFLPLPLSFSITGIAQGYLFAGIAVIILTAFLAAWRSQAAILFLTGIALLLPALPLAHGQIAWAPYAERYMYVSSGFWIASLAVGLSSLKRPYLRASCTALCLVLIPLAALTTYKRSTTWQTNVALFGDTVQKSPNHIEARILYMTALSKAGRLPEALEQYLRIKEDSRSWTRPKYFSDFAELLYSGGLKSEAWEVLNTSMAIPLPPGQKHPLLSNDWQKLYKFHTRLQQELFPKSKQAY
jgi:hypothetical protein